MRNLSLCGTALAALLLAAAPAFAQELGTASIDNSSPEEEAGQETGDGIVHDTSVDESAENGMAVQGRPGRVLLAVTGTNTLLALPPGLAAQLCGAGNAGEFAQSFNGSGSPACSISQEAAGQVGFPGASGDDGSPGGGTDDEEEDSTDDGVTDGGMTEDDGMTDGDGQGNGRGNGGRDNGEDSGDRNNGHGNDADGFDEGNPGNSQGVNRDKEDDSEEEEDSGADAPQDGSGDDTDDVSDG